MPYFQGRTVSFRECTPPSSLTNENGKSTMNESRYFLLKMGIFQPVMLVFRGVNFGGIGFTKVNGEG